MPWIFCFAVPIAVFFAVFFFVMHRIEKRLSDESGIPFYYYALSILIGASCGFIALVGIYLLAYLIPPDMSPVQAALDAQCGSGKYVADAKGYSNDPYEMWHGDGVFCEHLYGTWTCSC